MLPETSMTGPSGTGTKGMEGLGGVGLRASALDAKANGSRSERDFHTNMAKPERAR